MPNQALFYPSIDIKDDNWLKTALLYWDEFRTIVPESMDNPYSSHSTQALYDYGILTPIKVNSDIPEVRGLAEETIKYLSTNEGARVVASGGRQSSLIHAEKLPFTFEKFADIHPEKLPREVRDQINQMYDNVDESWVSVNMGFANFYMTMLASKLSERTGASLVTSDSMANDLAISLTLDAPLGGEVSNILKEDRHMRRYREYEAFGDRNERPATIAEGLLANLAISKISLSEDTSIQDIISFKEKHSDELGRFHQKVNQLCSSIQDDLPMAAMQERVETIYVNELKPSIKDLKNSLTGSNIKWAVKGMMNLSTFSAGAVLTSFGGLSIQNALLAGAGISFVTSKVLFNIEKREQYKEDPFAYLLSLDKQFG